MSITYRFATLEDMPAYTEMLRSFLLEQEKAGSPVRLTKRTLDVYRNVAHNYLSGSRFGAVVLAEEAGVPVGFALGGEDDATNLMDTNLGRVAFVWLIWVTPEHRKAGAALGMLIFGRPRLLELGFETASMCVREGNSGGEAMAEAGQALCKAYGAVLVERTYHFPLAKEPHHG